MATWTTSITTVALRDLADQYLVDGKFSFDELKTLLGNAATGGISTGEFTDLKTIYDNGNTLSLFSNAYVGAITYNVVYGNAANAYFTGGVTSMASVIPVGNITGGTTEANATKVVDEWFKGTDLPRPVAGGDTATGTASTTIYSYSTASGPLFVNGADPTDIKQGMAGDCYFVASLGTVADVNPAYITNMFTDNGNGTYGVKMFYNGKAVYTTVDMKLPINQYGTLGYAGSGTKSLTSEMWVALAEKAYAQLNQQFPTNEGSAWKGENSYQAIEGGWAQPLKQITGLNYKYYSGLYSSINDGFDSGTSYSTSAATYKQTIIDKLNGGAIGWLGSFIATTNATSGKKELVSGHAFMILGYNAGTDKFILRNPWGDPNSTTYNTQFEASIETFWSKGVIALTDAAIIDPVYTYTMASNASTSAAAVTEGTGVTFTITRSSSGTISTVYFSTANGTATGGTDYTAAANQSVTFAANETVKTITVTTLPDALTESAESFEGRIYKNIGDAAAAATATAFVKDPAVITSYTYTLANSANSSGAAVAEGGDIVVTVTRSSTGTASTVYLSTRAGTAGAADYNGLTKVAVDFAAYETSKTVTVKTLTDTLTESVESLNVDLYVNPGDTSATTTTTAYIKDTVVSNYSYVVTSNASSSTSAVAEGGNVVFTITRSGSGTASTIFASTTAGSASAADFQSITKLQVDFAANQTVQTVTIPTTGDVWLENPEYFRLDLFKYASDTTAFTYGNAWIKDTPYDPYNYTVTSNATTSDAAIAEGGKVTFTITRSSSGTESTVYLSTQAGTAGDSDIAPFTKQALTFASYETSKTITVSTYTDSTTESPEYFFLNLYKNQADSTYTTYGTAYVKDPASALPSYNYTVASSASTSDTAVAEGGSITFTITRSGSGSSSTVYVTTTPGTADGTDYPALVKSPVTFAAYETVKTVTVPAYVDGKTESPEYFWLDLFKNYSDTSYTTYGTGYIKDVAVVQNFNYTVSSTAGTSASAVAEGGNITFTITRSGTGAASTVYVSTTAGSATGADYGVLTKSPVTFASYETTKTITVPAYLDSSTESIEYFYLDLFKNQADTLYTTYASGYIKDAPLPEYTYSVTSSAGTSGTAVTEGGNVTFTITRSGSGSASTVYVSTEAGTADGSDYGTQSKSAVNFAAYETSKTVTVPTYIDSATEGAEYFWLNLYKSYSDASSGNWSTYGTGYVKDATVTNYNYTVTSSAGSEGAAATEGGNITFTITRSGTGSASTIYVSTTAGSAGSSDYGAQSKSAITFESYESVKTVTIPTYIDSTTEGSEYFWLDLYKSYADAQNGNWSTYGTGYIKDAVVTSYNYTVTSSAPSSESAATEGNNITFTITRSGSGTASTVYYTTTAGSADGSDFGSQSKAAVNFAAYETTKTITIPTYLDSTTEGSEYFWFDLYKSYADAQSGNWSTYATAYIRDAVVTNYNYSVSSTAGSSDSAVTEGGSITFTITRSGTGSSSTVYVSTTPGSADGSDYSAQSKSAVTFGTNETVKTVTVNTYLDSTTEGSEYFWLDLYKSYADAQNGNWSSYGTGYIKDASVTNYNYSVTSSADNSGAAVTEGGSITFTITRLGTGSTSTVYVSTVAGTADGSDYASQSKSAVTFGTNETVKTVTVNSYLDSTTEGSEYFWLELFKTYADAQSGNWSNYGTGYIKDATVTNYNYTVTSTTSSDANAVAEGGNITFTITRSGTGSASTVYVSTTAGSADGSDYSALSKSAVNFASNETVKTVTVSTYTDSIVEGTDYFWLDLYKSYADAQNGNYATYGTGYIKDAVVTSNFDYTVTSNATSGSPVTEGGNITFTITRSGTGSASTVYVTTTANTATASDYSALSKSAVNFGTNDTVKTVTVPTYTDSLTEGTESFWLDLFKTYDDASSGNWATYGTAYIQDGVTSNFTYTVTSNAETMNTAKTEGSPITFTITRSGTGSASTVYVTTTAYTANSSDYSALSKSAVNFASNETTKTVNISTYTDSSSEGYEAFWLDLFTSYTDAQNSNWATYGTGYIKDPGLTATPEGLGTGDHLDSSDRDALLPVLSSNEPLALSIGPVTVLPVAASFPGHSVSEFGNDFAFAALKDNGAVVTWGNAAKGGDSSAVAALLNGNIDVSQVFSTEGAFAALRADGSVVAWGDADFGGSLGTAASALDGLVDVTSVASTSGAFAALRADGSVVTWGYAGYGGDSSAVASQINGTNNATDVTKLYSNGSAFAALRADGSLVTWGVAGFGGDSTSAGSALNGAIDVVSVQSTGSAFAALRTDGSVVTWGNESDGGSAGSKASLLNGAVDVTKIFSTGAAFAALRTDGSVVTWGGANSGGDSDLQAGQLDGSPTVTNIASTNAAFAAIHSDGSVVTWGDANAGGDSSAVATALNGTIDVTSIVSTALAFAALRTDGSVVTWGYGGYGGDSSAVAAGLNGTIDVVSIVANDHAFAALRTDGSVITWGDELGGGDSSAVATLINGTTDVTQIYATATAFTALRTDGTLVSWGDPFVGGDAASVSSQLTSVASVGNVAQNDAFLDNVAKTLAGTANADTLVGASAADSISGSGGNDFLFGSGGNDTITGGAGIDIAGYAGPKAHYTLTNNGTTATVTDSYGYEGTDALNGVERLAFSDGNLALDLNGNAGSVAKILGVLFGPASVSYTNYVGAGLGAMDAGYTYSDLMAVAITLIPHSNAQLVDTLYFNLVGIHPDAATAAPFVAYLTTGALTQTQLAVLAADTDYNANNIDLVGLTAHGLAYV